MNNSLFLVYNMSGALIDELMNKVTNPIVTDEDLKLIFNANSPTQIHNFVSYHLRTGAIEKVMRGVYFVGKKRELKHSNFHLANVLYAPSFVSFESALSYWGLIPEGVREIMSSCYQSKKKEFKTSFGLFSYTYSPVSPFFTDVIQDESSHFLIAGPMRALFDLIYVRKKSYPSVNGLEADLRIDMDELQSLLKNYQASDIFELGELYKKKTTRLLANNLVKAFK